MILGINILKEPPATISVLKSQDHKLNQLVIDEYQHMHFFTFNTVLV